MFLNDVHKKEEIRNIATQDLRNLGIKFRPKKNKQNVQETKTRKLFKTPLSALPTQTVTLQSGQQLIVPKLVHELCSFILTKVDTEGIFRKGGSKSRQNEIRLSLDAGCFLGYDHHEIDVASVLKTFFRELPEPIFPYAYHELFLRCIILPSNNLNAILLSCLLLPSEHLNTLAYFMQFLHQVTECSKLNKMDAYNLAVVMGPTLLPVEEKLAPHATHRLTKICELFKLLVENASAIGVVPENIIERIALSSSLTSLTDEEISSIKKKKKRRSGSLTRMFNGLKKIVSSKLTEEVPAVTPDLLMTPCATRSAKKRKVDGAFSIKKKREILNKMPQNAALSTPYTPVSANPNPKRKTPDSYSKVPSKIESAKEKDKKYQWSLRSKGKSKNSDETASVSSKTNTGTRGMLERRWSQVSSQVATFRRNKKRNSCAPTLPQENQLKTDDDRSDKSSPNDENCNQNEGEEMTVENTDCDYVKISKAEYEDIKHRVTEIERRISLELEEPAVTATKKLNRIENVQDAYEQTLVQAEPLSPTTDQLARRLSRELKIRRSAEQKIIRSPSARKIGSIRRRSKELEKQHVKIQPWYVSKIASSPRANKEKSGIKSNIPKKSPKIENSYENIEIVKQPTTRSSSFHGESSVISQKSHRRHSNGAKSNSEQWRSADKFFRTTQISNNSENSRASLARLRSQNAGMVLAKAKLFDGLVDSDNSNKSTPTLIPRVRSSKLGAIRNVDRQSYRIRALKADEKKSLKKNASPRKRGCKSPNVLRQQRLQAVKNTNIALILQGNDCSVNKENKNTLNNQLKYKMAKDSVNSPATCHTPRSVPHIKKPFNVKSPKRLVRTPLSMETRSTPLKVIAAVRQNY